MNTARSSRKGEVQLSTLIIVALLILIVAFFTHAGFRNFCLSFVGETKTAPASSPSPQPTAGQGKSECAIAGEDVGDYRVLFSVKAYENGATELMLSKAKTTIGFAQSGDVTDLTKIEKKFDSATLTYAPASKLPELITGLNKFREWAKAAKENHLNVNKPLPGPWLDNTGHPTKAVFTAFSGGSMCYLSLEHGMFTSEDVEATLSLLGKYDELARKAKGELQEKRNAGALLK